MRWLFGYCFLIFILTCSCNEEVLIPSLENYNLHEGFKVTCVTSEPIIESPVDIIWDRNANPYIIEMPGYMSSLDGTNEKAPIGKLKRLVDNDKDGFYESSKTILDSLSLLRAAVFVNDGLLYAEPPFLYFATLKNDKVVGLEVVDSSYAVGGNVEHQANGLLLNVDNWIYSAKSNKRYRKKKGQWLIEYTGFRGQWGITSDDYGRLYYNDNSNPLRGDLALPGVLNFNPQFQAKHAYNRVVLEDRSVRPVQATAVNRGYLPDVLDKEGKLKNFTSACGPLVRTSSENPDLNEAFICGPEVNLVKKVTFNSDDLFTIAKPMDNKHEFLISYDEAFRPVNAKVGPDNAIYIVDMHKGIIQHKTYMTDYLRKKYEEKGLIDIHGKGRILRITRSNQSKIQKNESANLNSLEENSSFQQSMKIHNELLETNINKRDVIRFINKSESERASIHALYILEATDQLMFDEINLKAKDAFFISHYLKLARRKNFIISFEVLKDLKKRNNQVIDYHLLFYLSGFKDVIFLNTLRDIFERNIQYSTYFLEPIFAGMQGNEQALTDIFGPRPEIVKKIKSIAESEVPIRNVSGTDGLTRGLELYQIHCSSCHGPNGNGLENLAPELVDSEYVSGETDRLVKIMIYGLHGPIPLKGTLYDKKIAMPGIGGDESITDEMIKDIGNYIRNAFTTSPQSITEEQVRKIRQSDRPKDKMFTANELLN